MRNIKYKKLSIQNFLSIGNDTLEIDFQSGLNLITGLNIDNPERRNGTGKSAIIEGFYYALFGSTIRDIKKEFVFNNVTIGKPRVDLWLDIQTESGTNSYRITRHLKPSSVELWKLGEEDVDISKDSIANTNKYICELIGSNSVICKSCDILSLSDNVPFMAKKPEEKRKFIEDIFVLEIIGKMLKDLKEMIKENKSNKSISIAKLEEINNSIDVLKEQYEIQKKKIEDRSNLLQIRKTDLEKSITKKKKQISLMVVEPEDDKLAEKLRYKEALQQIETKIKDFTTLVITTQRDIDTLKSEMEKLLKMDVGIKCDKCLQEVPHDHQKVYTTMIQDIELKICKLIAVLHDHESNLYNWKTKKTKAESKMDEINVWLENNRSTAQDKKFLEKELSQFEEELDRLNHDIHDTSDDLDSFKENILKTETRRDDQEKIKTELIQQAEDLELCKFILGEEGIKSFIIKRLLDMLNSSIQKYITNLGMTMRCKFDEYFDEQITNDKGKSISYWNFSGGERKTVDLACAWAFKDIKKKITGVSSNVEFLDEIMDSAFDERGLDLLIDVLKDRIEVNDLSCYTISHRKETLKHVDGEIVNLEKENGITRRIID